MRRRWPRFGRTGVAVSEAIATFTEAQYLALEERSRSVGAATGTIHATLDAPGSSARPDFQARVDG
jgi:hypothetical protein